MPKNELLGKLREDLLNYDTKAAKEDAERIIQAGVSPLEAINVLTTSMREIGEKFARLELFLTNLMMAGDTMKSAMDVLLAKIPKEAVPSKGKVVIGTVKGDIHDIGKNIVIALLTASNFDVHDLGKDVLTSRFVEEAEKVGADIVMASALMTTTAPALQDMIKYFEAKKLREKYKIMVGGGAVTGEYAEEIGADGYGATAMDAVEKAEILAGK
jgi:trimethylamine corrinoid protein